MLGFVFAFGPSFNTHICMSTHACTHTHVLYKFISQPMISKNQYFPGRRKSRSNITNGQLSHKGNSIWQIIKEPFLMSCLSCKKSKLKSTICISKSETLNSQKDIVYFPVQAKNEELKAQREDNKCE